MLEAFRAVVLLIGGIAFGLTLSVTVLYVYAWKRLDRKSSRVPPYHVPIVGVAHMLMVAALEASILNRVRLDLPFSFFITPLSLVAFLLTIGSLLELLRSQHVHKVHSEVEAHYWEER